MNALTITTPDANAVVLHRAATDVAGAIREFALKRCKIIQGKKYPTVEVWQAVANGFGCVASSGHVEEVAGGIRAIGEVRRVSDGVVIATGEGFVGDDEPLWFGGVDAQGKRYPQRPLFARRAMAQTRGISRACRAAFAFVVPMIDAGLATTPAEEMEAAVVDVQPVVPAQERVVEATLNDVRVAESKPGAAKTWKAWFLTLESEQATPATFDKTLGEKAQALVGSAVRALIKPGRKPDSWEFVNIEAAQ